MAKLGKSTQSLVNAFPSWSDIRNDEQSNGQGLLNNQGLVLDDLFSQLENQRKNYYISSANINELDHVYRASFDSDFTFKEKHVSDDEVQYTPPIVSGYVNGTWLPVKAATKNTFEQFGYIEPATRVSFDTLSITKFLTDTLSAKMYGGLLSITQGQGSVTYTNLYLDYPSRLHIFVTGGITFLAEDKNGIQQRASIRIDGITKYGAVDSETIIILHNGREQSFKEWKKIDRVTLTNFSTDSTKVQIFENVFGKGFSPSLFPEADFYNLYTNKDAKQKSELFWEIEANSIGTQVLTCKTWVAQDVRDRVNGLTDITTMRRWNLLNTSNTSITPVDLAVVPFTNYLWIADTKNIFLYNRDWEIPAIPLPNKTTGAMSVIQMDDYHQTLNEVITLDFLWKRPVTEINKHRAYVISPSGTRYTLNNGLITWDPSAWTFGTPEKNFLRHSESFTLNERGSWIVTLEVKYANGTNEIDQRIISVDSKVPVTQFSLGLSGTENIIGLDISSDQKLYVLVLNSTGNVYTKRRVNLVYDYALFDYDKKEIFLREPYSQVRIYNE
jgi:hypothetical protein